MLDNFWVCDSTRVTEKEWRGIQLLGMLITTNVWKSINFLGI